jgi:hypothetical protein
MVTAYLGKSVSQDVIAHWLNMRHFGVPASRIQSLTRHGYDVLYSTGSLVELEANLVNASPVILFLRTGELPYWDIDTPHAVVLVGLTQEMAQLFDPAMEPTPIAVPVGDLMLAWSHFDYTYAIISLETQ